MSQKCICVSVCVSRHWSNPMWPSHNWNKWEQAYGGDQVHAHTHSHTRTRVDTSANTWCIISVLRDYNVVSVTMLTEGGWGKTSPGLPLAPRKSVGAWCVCLWVRERDVGVCSVRIRKARSRSKACLCHDSAWFTWFDMFVCPSVTSEAMNSLEITLLHGVKLHNVA